MKKILVLMLSLFFLSCGDDTSPLWVNSYDPNVDAEELAEICGDAQCGKVNYEGHQLVCGICEDGKYCDPDKKCVSNCETFNCGTMQVETYSGPENVDCGICGDNERCSTQNICLSDESICGTRKCGKVSFINDENKNVDVACGTCNEDEYCTEGQKCELISSECAGKCGSFTVDGYDGKVDVECDGCEGEFAYCSTDNECRTACGSRECGTQTVKMEGDVDKTFTCGDCGDGLNYCDETYKCKLACVNQDCGEDTVNKLDEGETTIACGTCSSPDYCGSSLNCTEGTESGSYLFDEEIVLDTDSGLMWVRSIAGELTQEGAVTHCNSSTAGGFEDWQLPNISQLRSIVNGCDKVGTGIDTVTGDDSETCGIISSCIDSTCSDDNCDGCTNSAGSGPQGLYLAADIWNYTGDTNGRFWSSSAVPDKADSFWFIRFSNASVAYNWDGNEYNVICVRIP